MRSGRLCVAAGASHPPHGRNGDLPLRHLFGAVRCVEPPQRPPEPRLCLFAHALGAGFQLLFDPHVELPIRVEPGAHVAFRHPAPVLRSSAAVTAPSAAPSSVWKRSGSDIRTAPHLGGSDCRGCSASTGRDRRTRAVSADRPADVLSQCLRRREFPQDRRARIR